jgi:hypothetical protein
MNRIVETGEPVVDQFPAFENDGYTKRSGLTVGGGDFAISVFKDGVPDATAVTITEVGILGEYKVAFTPSADGLYVVQVLTDFNKDIWAGFFDSTVDTTSSIVDAILAALVAVQIQVDKIDLAPTLGTATVFSGSLMDRFMNKDVSKTYNQGTDSLEALRDRTG